MTCLYVDSPGIWTVYEQTINDVENEFDRIYRNDPIGSLEEKTSLARRLGHLLGSDKMTHQAAVGRSKRLVEEIKAKLSVDDRLARLIDYQQDLDPTGMLRRLEAVVTKWRFGVTNLAFVEAHFNMPQFFDAKNSEALAYESGLVEFEFSDSVSYGLSRQKTYGFHSSSEHREIPRILMAANLSKFQHVRFGKISADGPEAMYFHSFSGRRVPLRVLGTVSREKGLFRLKPLAIWRCEQEKSTAQTAEHPCPTFNFRHQAPSVSERAERARAI